MLLTFAVVRAIEIIGEAAARISSETLDAYPNLPWSAIVGMRNRLIHTYFDVDPDLVWQTIVEDLPTLQDKLRLVLESNGR